ncbi:MAG: hypothetical protein QXG39_10480 [Candidatus Aenigmatarchaeota archaeon]
MDCKNYELLQLILDLVAQECLDEKDMFDNMGLSVYEEAFRVLERHGLIKRLNKRIALIQGGGNELR